MLEPIIELLGHTGFSEVTWQMLVMWFVVAVLLYLAVYYKFEPLLLVPIAFGTLLANLPTEGIMEGLEFAGRAVPLREDGSGGLFYYLFQGIHLELFPPIIFMGVGALTDFGPLIANPRTMLLGAAAQFGVFGVFLAAYGMKEIGIAYSLQECGAISIIGGADGPTSIFLANKLAPHLLGPIAVAAYSYMALVPVIQPPIMRALTTPEERRIRMPKLRQVSRLEKLIFATVILMIGILVVPAAAPLLFMLFFGNFMRECGVVERLSKSAQNEIINIVTIFLGASVGITMHGEVFLTTQTLGILSLGVLAFAVATASGILMAKVMNLFSHRKINPLIGSAGVSAVPMAARVSQVEGQRADPTNFLLMHAMGPNVAGVIGTALVAGFFMTVLG
jgi:oxaloacetate decarboxylase beta subunit